MRRGLGSGMSNGPLIPLLFLGSYKFLMKNLNANSVGGDVPCCYKLSYRGFKSWGEGRKHFFQRSIHPFHQLGEIRTLLVRSLLLEKTM